MQCLTGVYGESDVATPMGKTKKKRRSFGCGNDTVTFRLGKTLYLGSILGF